MEFQISEDILRKTKCKKGFSCLSGQRNDLCKVKNYIEGKVIFLEALNDHSCYYSTSFGYAYICNCPTRKEIYDRYQI
jgi:hypothetical protein